MLYSIYSCQFSCPLICCLIEVPAPSLLLFCHTQHCWHGRPAGTIGKGDGIVAGGSARLHVRAAAGGRGGSAFAHIFGGAACTGAAPVSHQHVPGASKCPPAVSGSASALLNLNQYLYSPLFFCICRDGVASCIYRHVDRKVRCAAVRLRVVCRHSLTASLILPVHTCSCAL